MFYNGYYIWLEILPLQSTVKLKPVNKILLGKIRVDRIKVNFVGIGMLEQVLCEIVASFSI